MNKQPPKIIIHQPSNDVSIDFPYPIYLSMGKSHTHLILDAEEYALLKQAMNEKPQETHEP